MSTSPEPASSEPRSSGVARARSALLLAIPGVVAFALPLIGFLGSLLLPVFASRVGHRIWPRSTPRAVILSGLLVVVGFWLPAAVAIFSQFSQFSQAPWGFESTLWLLVPLCVPTGATLLVAVVMAASAYLIGLTVSVLTEKPWPWVVGAWASPLAYSAAAHWLVEFVWVC